MKRRARASLPRAAPSCPSGSPATKDVWIVLIYSLLKTAFPSAGRSGKISNSPAAAADAEDALGAEGARRGSGWAGQAGTERTAPPGRLQRGNPAGSRGTASPPKGFPFPSPIPGLPAVLAMPAPRSGGMRVRPEELVPRFGGRHGRGLHPRKPKERVQSRPRHLPAQHRRTRSPSTQPENGLIF